MNDTIDEVPFEVTAARQGTSVRLRIAGELDLHREGQLRGAFEGVLAGEPFDQLVLDLRELQFLDSSGLRVILLCRDRTRAAGAAFLLAAAPGPVTRLFAVAGVQSWFDYE